MGVFEHFPYTNFHELNLDWVIDFIRSGKLDIEATQKLVEELIKNQPGEIKKAVNAELQSMVASGEFNEISEKYITPQVSGLAKSGLDLHKVLFIGDSFLDTWYTGRGYENWAVYFCQLLGLAQTDYKIYGFGGAGYIGGDVTTNRNYEQLFTNVVVPELGDTISEYSAVIVFSGPNDYEQAYATEYGAVYSFLTAVRNAMPNAAIIGVNGATLDQKYNSTQFATNDAYTAFGAVNFPNAAYWMVGRDDMFLDDQLHPNEKGMRQIAGMVYNAIKTGDDTCYHYHVFTQDNSTAVITVANSFAYFFAVSNVAEAAHNKVIVTFPKWFAPTANKWIGAGWSFNDFQKHGNAILWSSGQFEYFQDEFVATGEITINGTMMLGR